MKLFSGAVNEPNLNSHICRLCRDINTRPALRVEGVPALLGVSGRSNLAGDHFLDFNVFACESCGLVQTDAVFDKDWYEGVHSHGVGKVWDEHRAEFAAFISEAIGSENSSAGAQLKILEVGPSVNPIARELKFGESPSVDYIDLMPEAPFSLESNEMYVSAAFPDQESGPTYDLLIASHVLEHADSVSAFFDGISASLKPGGVAAISIPDFQVWFSGGYWNAITSEHISYPRVEHLIRLASSIGKGVSIRRFRKHSVFAIVTSHKEAEFETASGAMATVDDARGEIARWAEDIVASVKRYESKVSLGDNMLLLTGASHLSQYLWLMSETIRSRALCVLDNALDKHGMRLYGTTIDVFPFSHVKDFNVPQVIVPQSPYTTEITRQTLSLNPDAVVVS